MIRPLALAVALGVPLPALAQDTVGTITGTLNGEETTWYITYDGADSQSAYMTIVPPSSQVTLWGHAEEGSIMSLQDSLILDFFAIAQGGNLAANTLSLQHLDDGYSGGWIADDETGSLSVTVTTLEPTDAGLTIAGSFEAEAVWSPNMMSRELDPSRTAQISGRFEATLPAQ